MAATFYYAVTGRAPTDSIDRYDDDDIIMPSAVGVKVSPKKEDVLLKALAVNYQNRYQTMAEFITELTKATVQTPQVAPTTAYNTADLIKNSHAPENMQKQVFQEAPLISTSENTSVSNSVTLQNTDNGSKKTDKTVTSSQPASANAEITLVNIVNRIKQIPSKKLKTVAAVFAVVIVVIVGIKAMSKNNDSNGSYNSSSESMDVGQNKDVTYHKSISSKKTDDANAKAKLVFTNAATYCTKCEINGTPIRNGWYLIDLSKYAKDGTYESNGLEIEKALCSFMGQEKDAGYAVVYISSDHLPTDAYWSDCNIFKYIDLKMLKGTEKLSIDHYLVGGYPNYTSTGSEDSLTVYNYELNFLSNDSEGVSDSKNQNINNTPAQASAVESNTEYMKEIKAAEKGDIVKFGNYDWYIIDKTSTGCTLLCKDVLADSMPFNDRCVNTCWKDCTLRTWLNNSFYKQFSSDEKSKIKKTKCNNDDKWSKDGENDTEDYIFLLSDKEAKAVSKEILETDHHWWLRTSSYSWQDRALYVAQNGNIVDQSDVDTKNRVRPALNLRF